MPRRRSRCFLSGRIGVKAEKNEQRQGGADQGAGGEHKPGKANEARRSWQQVTPSSVPNGKAIPSTMKVLRPTEVPTTPHTRLRPGPETLNLTAPRLLSERKAPRPQPV